MGGTVSGGIKARDKNLARDPDWYKKIGAKGGKNGTTGGFACQLQGKDGLTGKERARYVGQKGGRISRRTKKY
jgi:general stress protein YciG